MGAVINWVRHIFKQHLCLLHIYEFGLENKMGYSLADAENNNLYHQ